MLEVGDDASQFELPNQHGDPVRRSDFDGQRLIAYFYPRANTDGCTTEAREFDAALPAFADDYELGFDHLSDERGEVASLYDSYGERNMFGNTFDGVFRNTYVGGPDGRIEAAYENVSPAGHAEAVLADLEADATS